MRALTHRKTVLLGWATLVVTLAVCGLGLTLTIVQLRDVRGILLELEKRTAETERAELERFLDQKEGQVLADLAATGGEPKKVASLMEKEPLVEEPFFFLEDGGFLPLAGKLAVRPGITFSEPAPARFESALKIAWSQAPQEEKEEALEDVYLADEIPRTWRLRALSLLCALKARGGDPRAAASRYEELFKQLDQGGEPAAGMEEPSYFQLVIARSQCLLAASDEAGALEIISCALRRALDGTAGGRIEELAFFLHKAEKTFRERAKPPPAGLNEAAMLLKERTAAFTIAQTLRGLASSRSRSQSGALEDERSHHYLQEEASDSAPLLAVWRGSLRGGSSEPTHRLPGVAFRMNIDKLKKLLCERLRTSSTHNRLTAEVARSPAASAFLELADLQGDRGFIHLGLTQDDWSELVSGAQKPLKLAACLIVGLALLLTLGLVVFFRGALREMELSRMKTELVANVSHELKTPLALIRLFGETLLLGRVTDASQARKYYEIITRESERLTHLIANVLNFASIEAGKKSYQMTPMNVAAPIRETYESYRFHLDEKGFTHRLEEAPGLPAVEADSDAVSQAFLNLLQNAVKYSPKEKEITVKVGAADGSVRVSVEDRGVGISREDQGKIWDDYYRTREARALGTRGSGLGLSLVQHIMKAHRGRVDLLSESGKGSVFTLVFPAAPSQNGSGPVERGAT